MEAIAKEVAAAEAEDDEDEEDEEEEEEEELHKNLDGSEGHHASDGEAEHSGGGGNSPAHKDSNGGASAGGASPAHLVENDDDIDYQMCINAETPKQREGYCNEMFGGETLVVKECSKNFCTFCCESKFRKTLLQ